MRRNNREAGLSRMVAGVAVLVQRLSLKHKLIVVTMLTCVSSLIMVGVVFGMWECAVLRHTMVRDLSAHAEILADNCKAAITFHDAADAREVLQSVGAAPSVTAACLYMPDGGLFAAYVRKGTDVILPRRNELSIGHTFGWRSLVLTRPILLDGESIGTVYLRSNLDSLYLRLQHGIVVIVCVLLLSSLAAYLISSRLQRIISVPILRLATVARRVSEKKEYTVRAEPSGSDEVGLLVLAFNEMLGQIQQRDAALVEANEQLEAHVQKRTAELVAVNSHLTDEITTRREIERALAEANENLAETVQNLRRSNKELQDFAYVVAHDLRAPLRGIGTLADWIASDYADRFDEQGQQQLRLLKGRVTRLTELINGILHYSEIGRVANRHEEVDLNALVCDTIALLAPPAHVEARILGELPVVIGEKVRLGQVFHNLIDNAIKYLDKPEGLVEIGCIDRGDAWEFTVTDNGPGIEPKYFDKIFQMFQTLVPRDQRESTGIGLPIVKKIVELLGGNIWVKSQPGKGTTFLFTFPKEGHVPEEAVLAVDEIGLYRG